MVPMTATKSTKITKDDAVPVSPEIVPPVSGVSVGSVFAVRGDVDVEGLPTLMPTSWLNSVS